MSTGATPHVDASLLAAATGGGGAVASAGTTLASPPVTIVRVQHNYEPKNEDELALRRGQLIKVTKKEDDGWWHGEAEDGKTGVFPSNFVQEQ